MQKHRSERCNKKTNTTHSHPIKHDEDHQDIMTTREELNAADRLIDTDAKLDALEDATRAALPDGTEPLPEDYGSLTDANADLTPIPISINIGVTTLEPASVNEAGDTISDPKVFITFGRNLEHILLTKEQALQTAFAIITHAAKINASSAK
jgi:hypothetical protein